MSCKHDTLQPVGSVTWCKRCGALREGDAPWQLTENEAREVWLDSLCPVCEDGEPLPVEVDENGKKIFRWTCRHWINEGPLGATP